MGNSETEHTLSEFARKVEHPSGENYLDFIGKQIFVIDPRTQGFGLSEYPFLDAYANKFLILAGSEGVFISPKAIPIELLEYYDEVGLSVPTRENILSVETTKSGGSVLETLAKNTIAASLVAKRKGGSYVIPYMVTDEVAAFAYQHGFQTLADAATVERMADKAVFQEELAKIAGDIKKDTGYDTTIPMVRVVANDQSSLEKAYAFLSQNGKKDIVVVRPKSASGLGVFFIKAERGREGLSDILQQHFTIDDEVLLEEFVAHNHSPSMQGVQKQNDAYEHLYFGRQIISMKDGQVTYESSQIPFGSETLLINPRDLDRMRVVHEALGEHLVRQKDIAGIAGFDGVTNISTDGSIKSLKITELNLHLPSSIAVYAAIQKVFLNGFDGIAHNINIPLGAGQTSLDFLRNNRQQVVRKQGTYGIFPLNLSYDDKVDIVVFAHNEEHVQQLLANLVL